MMDITHQCIAVGSYHIVQHCNRNERDSLFLRPWDHINSLLLEGAVDCIKRLVLSWHDNKGDTFGYRKEVVEASDQERELPVHIAG